MEVYDQFSPPDASGYVSASSPIPCRYLRCNTNRSALDETNIPKHLGGAVCVSSV
jgi:hypothetical protein